MSERVAANSYDGRALNLLHDKLVAILNETHTNLGKGTQVIREDAAATGMNMVRYVGMIYGLQVALEQIKITDDELNGRTPQEG